METQKKITENSFWNRVRWVKFAFSAQGRDKKGKPKRSDGQITLLRCFRVFVLIVFVSLGCWLNMYFPFNHRTPSFINFLYWPFAFGWSAFLAAFNFEIHEKFEIRALHGASGKPIGYGGLTWSPRFHQFFFALPRRNNWMGNIISG